MPRVTLREELARRLAEAGVDASREAMKQVFGGGVGLREELARRLMDVREKQITGPPGPRENPYLVWADECIRQMEWARQHHPVRPPRITEPPGHYIMCPCGEVTQNMQQYGLHYDRGHFDVGGPLTLAPEDWTP